MEIAVNKANPKFVPVEVKITLESQAEVDVLMCISRLNIRLPDLVADEFNLAKMSPMIGRDIAQELLDNLRIQLDRAA